MGKKNQKLSIWKRIKNYSKYFGGSRGFSNYKSHMCPICGNYLWGIRRTCLSCGYPHFLNDENDEK